MTRPTDYLWITIKRLLKYINDNLQHGLLMTLSNNIDLVAFSDANKKRYTDEKKSISALCVFFGDNLVS